MKFKGEGWEVISHVIEAEPIIGNVNETNYLVKFPSIESDTEFLLAYIRIFDEQNNSIFGHLWLSINEKDYICNLPTYCCIGEWYSLDVKLRIIPHSIFNVRLKINTLSECNISVCLKGLLYRRTP